MPGVDEVGSYGFTWRFGWPYAGAHRHLQDDRFCKMTLWLGDRLSGSINTDKVILKGEAESHSTAWKGTCRIVSAC